MRRRAQVAQRARTHLRGLRGLRGRALLPETQSSSLMVPLRGRGYAVRHPGGAERSAMRVEDCVFRPERTSPANDWGPPPVVCGRTQFSWDKYVPERGRCGASASEEGPEPSSSGGTGPVASRSVSKASTSNAPVRGNCIIPRFLLKRYGVKSSSLRVLEGVGWPGVGDGRGARRPRGRGLVMRAGLRSSPRSYCVCPGQAGSRRWPTSRSYLGTRVRGVEGTNARPKVRTVDASSYLRNRP